MDDSIKKLYIEPTSHCNLSCAMCSRNHWMNESIGHMDMALFEKAISELSGIPSLHTVFFGGVGEPLVHPHIVSMVKAAKETGRAVEMITNGTLLTQEMIEELIGAGLDRIFISVDSLEEAQYADIRGGADYQSVNANINRLLYLRIQKNSPMKVGISFVLMKKNAEKLSELPAFARKYGISDIKVTNLIPNSKEMTSQILYDRSISLQLGAHGYDINYDIPPFDIDKDTISPVLKLAREYVNFSSMGSPLERKTGYCRFVQEGNVFIRWDGEVCPCMALLHSGKTYLFETERITQFASYGNMRNGTLQSIWQSPEYASFRKRVKEFSFSPCIVCGGCEDRESNLKDCFGNTFPVCGACLWAQGFIQCP